MRQGSRRRDISRRSPPWTSERGGGGGEGYPGQRPDNPPRKRGVANATAASTSGGSDSSMRTAISKPAPTIAAARERASRSGRSPAATAARRSASSSSAPAPSAG